MNTFLFGLVSNLALLAIALAVCHLCNRIVPGAAIHGGYVFIVLVSVALLLDAALTFLVFADAQSRYSTFSGSPAFFERAGAYAIAAAIALACARLSHRARRVRPGAQDTLVIRTSAYTESHLPM